MAAEPAAYDPPIRERFRASGRSRDACCARSATEPYPAPNDSAASESRRADRSRAGRRGRARRLPALTEPAPDDPAVGKGFQIHSTTDDRSVGCEEVHATGHVLHLE